MMRTRRLSFVLLVAVVLSLVAASPSSASSSASASAVEYGRVLYVADGDTIDVALDGDSGEATRIRFVGIQAMELYTYHHDLSRVTGECHAVEAAQRLGSLLYTSDGTGRRVRLTARDASSTNLGRSARFVAVQAADGTWSDVGAVLMREGQVLPSYQRTEYTWNRRYRALAAAAAADHVGLWDPSFCGAGPAASVSLRVNYDAPGNDTTNVNGEYVRVINRGSRTLDLSGWWVRDSATRAAATADARRRGFIFPAGARVAAGKSVVVHVGVRPKHAAAGNFYYGQHAPIFENPTGAPEYLGDGAYLFDPQGDLRSSRQYS